MRDSRLTPWVFFVLVVDSITENYFKTQWAYMQWLNSLIAGLIAVYLFFFPLWLVFACKYGRQQPKRGTVISIIILLIAGGLYALLDHILHLSPNGSDESRDGMIFAGVIMATVINSLGMMAGVFISFLDAKL